MPEPENLVLNILGEMRAEMADMRAEMATKSEIASVRSGMADLRSEVHSLRADVASDIMSLEKRLGDQISTLRRAVMEYHSSTIGHGVLYSEIDDRVRRIERHLKIDGPGSH